MRWKGLETWAVTDSWVSYYFLAAEDDSNVLLLFFYKINAIYSSSAPSCLSENISIIIMFKEGLMSDV